MNDTAISIKNLKKVYKLYDRPVDRLIEALGLSRKKRYTEHYALNGIDLEVKKGETIGIIGTNGSGKSTILKIITGVLNATSGEVKVDGRISALLELGAGFNMEYSGIENVYLNGTMTGFTKEEIDAKLSDILEFADIGEYVHQPVKTYSSGMFVRLAFAVAININPEILIVDEALSVGDVFFQAKCYHKFEEFKSQGKTILFVSHDLSSVSRYCDRVVLLNRGDKLAEGAPKEIIDIYKQVLVGQYRPAEEVSAGSAGEHVSEVGTSENVSAGSAGEHVSAVGAAEEVSAGSEGEHVSAVGTAEEVSAGSEGEHVSAGSAGGTDSEAGAGNSSDGYSAGAAASGVSATEEAATGAAAPGIRQDTLEYGSEQARIVECFITDDKGLRTNSIIKGSEFSVHMKVQFYERLAAPIFAMTIKNALGIEITGTNSMVEKAFLEPVEKGAMKTAVFTQRMTLQGGDYLISFGLTGYEGEEFKVYHRLYDAIDLSVISDKNTVGYYDMESVITIESRQ